MCLLVSVHFRGGIKLIGIGNVGEYNGSNYIETKKRTKYIIKNEKKNG